jgi:hypothetical protein
MAFTSDLVSELFDSVSGELATIQQDARGYSLDSWKAFQIAKGGALGGGAAIIPVIGYLTLPAELLALMRVMHRSAIGVCAIELDHVDHDQFANILAIWSGSVTLTEDLGKQLTAKVMASTAYMVGGTTGVTLWCHAYDESVCFKLRSGRRQKTRAESGSKGSSQVCY